MPQTQCGRKRQPGKRGDFFMLPPKPLPPGRRQQRAVVGAAPGHGKDGKLTYHLGEALGYPGDFAPPGGILL